jgi:hypothetical protein
LIAVCTRVRPLGPDFVGAIFAQEELKNRTSNIERPTSNFEWEKMRKQKNKSGASVFAEAKPDRSLPIEIVE